VAFEEQEIEGEIENGLASSIALKHVERRCARIVQGYYSPSITLSLGIAARPATTPGNRPLKS
jgi:hypothetical protein